MVKIMFNSENLKVGDKFYSVKGRNQAFHRKKIHKEIDGEDWFKYDMPLRTYEIVTWEVLGIIHKELEGQWPYDLDGIDTATEYYVRYMDDTHVGNHKKDFYDDTTYFVDMDEALVYKLELEAQAKEMDML